MSKLSLALLLCISALFAGSARAADLSTVALFNPAAFEAPESVQFDRHGNAYISLALTGAGRVHASGGGFDDFAFDVHGNLYGTTDPFNTIVRVRPDGTSEVLLTAADGLDGPTSAAFGVGKNSKALYITNAAFPFFPGPTPRRPSLMRLEVGIPGRPRP